MFNNQKPERINIDELYNLKKKRDLNALSSYIKVLNRAHSRIKTTSRQKKNMQCCWFTVPEFLVGTPRYDIGSCIAYIMNELTENGFLVKYTHPNLILISWRHWIPDYARDQYKKHTGITIDGFGIPNKDSDNYKQNLAIENNRNENNKNLPISTINLDSSEKKNQKVKFRSVSEYKPTGNMIYDDNLLAKFNN
tara:strand:+ start:1594 stop:2175 length:582 start_codon:yes stop_codon:yes gene_type:complete